MVVFVCLEKIEIGKLMLMKDNIYRSIMLLSDIQNYKWIEVSQKKLSTSHSFPLGLDKF